MVGFRRRLFLVALLWPLFSANSRLQTASLDEQFLMAAGTGNVAAAAALLDHGANIEAENWRGATALCSAAEHGYIEVVKLLLDRGANVDGRELERGRTPLINATAPPIDAKHAEVAAQIVMLLLDKNAGSEGESLSLLLARGHYDAARVIIGRGRVFPAYLNLALEQARRAKQPALVDFLLKAGAKDPTAVDPPRSAERMKLVAGTYRSATGQQLVLRPGLGDEDVDADDLSNRSLNQWLLLERAGQPVVRLSPIDLSIFRAHDMKIVVRLKDGTVPPPQVSLRLGFGSRPEIFTRTGDVPPPTVAVPPSRSAAVARRPVPRSEPSTPASREWPSFRGNSASGVMDNAHPPATWDLPKRINIKWVTPIPGLAHASPVVWGNKVFVITAAPLGSGEVRYIAGDDASNTGLSDNRSLRDDVPHSWRVYALDRQSGKILWERVAHEGLPRTARHVMQSQANSTPATDGVHLVVFLGSEGLYCYDPNGKLLWKKDLGTLRSAYVMDPTYEWNTGGSPIIYNGLVFLQVDLAEGSFIAAFRVGTGEEVWRAKRDELPSWSTPLIFKGPRRTELITAATNYARSYDPATGRELWRMGKHATHVSPAPIASDGLIVLTSGSGGTIQPIYTIVPGAEGDITLGDDETSNGFVLWSTSRGRSSRATPIIYGDLLYVLSDPGVLSAYDLQSGKRLYQRRLPSGGTSNYTASPVASDGHLYYPTADGDVVVVKAGSTFEPPKVNPIGEPILASPAISQGMIIFRTQRGVVAVAETPSDR